MEKIRQEKNICPRCGKEFSCSKSARCWCHEVILSTEIMEMLAEKYDNCLCPECLNEYSRLSR